MSDYNSEILIDGCRELGISLSDAQIRQFIRYYEMLYERNQVMNLTAVTQWEEVQVKHFLDSLLLCRAVDLSGSLRVLDMGSGAGFPGIPLKIVFSQLEIVLADSLNKRVLFLNDVIQDLGLNGIEAVHGRAEDLGRRKEYRESFDLVVSRAVANLSSLSEYCLPMTKTGGRFISYKSARIEEEVRDAERAIHMLGGGDAVIQVYPLPKTDMERSFVSVEKKSHTPPKYPRKAGTPSKDPLH